MSAVLLKQFQKDRKQIIEEVELLGNRFIYDLNKLNAYPEKAFYKVLKKDFWDDFLLYRSNVISHKARNNKICYPHIYSLNNNQHDILTSKYGFLDPRDPYDIKYLVEDSFGDTERYIGLFYDYLKKNGLDKNYFLKYKNEITAFVYSNEFRALNLYNVKKETFNLNSKDSKTAFDKYYFCTFIKLYNEYILDSLDAYSSIDVYNYIYSKGLLTQHQSDDYSNHIKKSLVKVHLDMNNTLNKNYIVIYNKSDLKYILSDVATSIFYNNFNCFNDILKLIGINNFNGTPKKISIMPISPDIAIVLSDVPFYNHYMEINKSNTIKCFNSIFFSTNNEWLIIYDINKKRSEILNESFLEKIHKNERMSNALHWFKNGLEIESFDNSNFGYKKPHSAMFNIYTIIRKISLFSGPIIYTLNSNSFYVQAKLNSKNIIFTNIKNNGFTLHRYSGKSLILYINDAEIYSVIQSFDKIQFMCFREIFINEGILNDMYIDNNKKRIVCLNFDFKKKFFIKKFQ